MDHQLLLFPLSRSADYCGWLINRGHRGFRSEHGCWIRVVVVVVVVVVEVVVVEINSPCNLWDHEMGHISNKT